jgi:aminoglycoside 2''-phosphotransferase
VTAGTIDWQRLESGHPPVKVRSVEFLGEGWTSWAYLVNAELVFRFPKRSEVWEEIDREVAFLAEAADGLPLPVPRYVALSRDSDAGPHGYAAYRYLPGQALTLAGLSLSDRSAAAEKIARFMVALHAYQPSAALAFHLPGGNERARAIHALKDAEEFVVQGLSTAQAVRLRDRITAYVDLPGNFEFRPVILHADFSRDHILALDRRLTGVIDFSDVSLGDPDYDFSSLFLDFGEAFTLQIAARYGHTHIAQLRAKLRYFEVEDFIDTIVHGNEYALEGQQETAWRRLRECLSRP